MPRPSRVSQVSIKIGDVERAIPVKDGGKAWLLVAGAFICQMLCAGLVQGMGVTFVELQNYFGASATEVSWIGSCLTFSACSVSVASGALSRRYGCRPVIICGGLVASLSMIAASFSEVLWHLYISLSLTGFGCGLALPAAISVIGFNFQVHFGIANGLQYAGVGVGIMSIPPFFQLLFDLYNWQGALLIYGSLLLNVCASGVLMKPSAAEIYSVKQKTVNYSFVRSSSGAASEARGPAAPVGVDPKRTEQSLPSDEGDDDVFVEDGNNQENNKDESSDVRTEEMKSTRSDSSKRQSSVRFEVEAGTVSALIGSKSHGDPIHDSFVQREKSFCGNCITNIVKSMKEAADIVGISILWEHPNFLCFAFAVMMFGFGYASCLSYFIPRAIQDVGIPELEASLLLTVLGVCSLIARLTNGLVVDLGLITPLKFFCLSCLVCAVSSFFTPFTHSYVSSFVCAGLFGMASGVANPMLAMVSRELVGQKVMASALGILMLFNGVGSVVGIFTMGFVYDHFGNYNISFFIAGCDLLLLIFVVFVGKALTKKLPSSRRSSRTSSAAREESPDVQSGSPKRRGTAGGDEAQRNLTALGDAPTKTSGPRVPSSNSSPPAAYFESSV